MSNLAVRRSLEVTAALGLAVSVGAQDAPRLPDQSVLPDVPTKVTLSNRDINRIVCVRSTIDGYQFSEEKGVVVDASGSDAFIKFLIEKRGEEQKYVNVRSEFYFNCGGVTYTLLGSPKNVPAMTIYLVPGTGQAAQENQAIFSPISEEERPVRITNDILSDRIPSSFTVNTVRERFNSHILPKIDVSFNREVVVTGTRYSAREYLLRARADVTYEERQFLNSYFGAGIASITAYPLALKKGEVGRVVLVYRGDKP